MWKKNKKVWVIIDHNSDMNEGYSPTYAILGVYDDRKLAKKHYDRIASAWYESPRYDRIDRDETHIEVYSSDDVQTTFDDLAIIEVNLNKEYYD